MKTFSLIIKILLLAIFAILDVVMVANVKTGSEFFVFVPISLGMIFVVYRCLFPSR